jgi:crotonobetainyl-CoA:carnitine CoA-transferase CaiB-like acyl-CoA transferase
MSAHHGLRPSPRSERPADPRVQANEDLVTLDNGLQAPPLPFELDGVRPPRCGAPDLGRDTDEVLQTVCGYTWDEVIALKAAEVVW